MISPEELQQWKDACEKATPGPWEFERIAFDDGDFTYERNDDHALISLREQNYQQPMKAKFDSQFIALSRDALPRLIEENKALKAEVERLRAEVSFYIEQMAEHAETNTKVVKLFSIQRDEAESSRDTWKQRAERLAEALEFYGFKLAAHAANTGEGETQLGYLARCRLADYRASIEGDDEK